MYDRGIQNSFRSQAKLRSYERSRTYVRPEQSRLQRKSIAKHLSYANIKPSVSSKPESSVQVSQVLDTDQVATEPVASAQTVQKVQANYNNADNRSDMVSPNTSNIKTTRPKPKSLHEHSTARSNETTHLPPRVNFKKFSSTSTLSTTKKSTVTNRASVTKIQSKLKASSRKSLFVPRVISEGSSKIYNIAKTAIFLVKNPITNLERASIAELEPSVKYGVLGRFKFNSKVFPENLRLSNIVLYGMASILFLSGMGVVYNGFMTNRRVNAVIADGISGTSGSDIGKESKPGSVGGLSVEKPSNHYVQQYTVAPDLPKYVKIDKLGINAIILSMGVDSKNKLEAPNNIYNAGWYNGSSRPGEAGGMLLEGHSGIGNYPGIFGHLDNLNKGDTIQITRGDNKIFSYKVVEKKVFDVKKVDMGSMMVSKNPDKPGLNLITCFGEATPGTTEFSHRQIVYAVQQ